MASDEINKSVREKMLNITDITLEPIPSGTGLIKPVRMNFYQDGKVKNWDLMRACRSVAVIVFNISRKKLILIKQFRPAAYYGNLPETCRGKVDLRKYPISLGVTIELCSAFIDNNEPLNKVAQEQVKGKCGYDLPNEDALRKIITYRSVGSSGSRQTLFYVEVTDDMNICCDKDFKGGDEIVEIVEMSIEDVKKYINSEEVQSPPEFLTGISWFLENKQDRYT